MVERTPIFNIFCQLVLLLGLVTALAPFAVVLIAASHDLRTVNLVPMPLIPGAISSRIWRRPGAASISAGRC